MNEKERIIRELQEARASFVAIGSQELVAVTDELIADFEEGNIRGNSMTTK